MAKLAAVIVLYGLVAAGCSEQRIEAPAPGVDRVRIQPLVDTLLAYDSTLIRGSAFDAASRTVKGVKLTWGLSDPAAGTLIPSDTAVIVVPGNNGHAASTVFLRMQFGALTDSVPLHIRVLCNRFTLSAAEFALLETETARLSVIARDREGIQIPDAEVRFRSTNRAIAAVDLISGEISAELTGAAYVIAQCMDRTLASDSARVVVAELRQPELAVRYVQRTPAVRYDQDLGGPAPGLLPEGASVWWDAHVKNWGPANVLGIGYAWRLDGQLLAAGTVDIAAGAEVEIKLPWRWTTERHTLSFVIDTGDALAEESEANNEFSLYTDALPIAFLVRQDFYDHVRRLRRSIRAAHGVGDVAIEDYAQREVVYFNELLSTAAFAPAPEGRVQDRVRLDEIIVQPIDFFSTPNQLMFPPTSDLYFVLAGIQLVGIRFDTNPASFLYLHDATTLHEMLHSRSLVDLYAFDVSLSSVHILEDGIPVGGTPLMPSTGASAGLVYDAPLSDIMDRAFFTLSEWSIRALNEIAGMRSPRNVTGQPLVGDYLRSLPAENWLRLQDGAGAPLSNASVKLYYDTAWAYYQKHYNSEPDLELTADAQGLVNLGSNPLGPRLFLTGLPAKPMVTIVRVEQNGRVGYGFFPGYLPSLECLRGNRLRAEYDFPIRLISK